MQKIWRRRLLGLAAIALGTAALSVWMNRRSDGEHVILISIDTLRRDHVGLYGYSRPTTPNLDAFAQRAIVFDDAIAAHTNTGPSHATMLTGLTPPQHGITRNGVRLGGKVTTLAQLLERAGYHTGAFVSGFTLRAADTGLQRGFDTYDDQFPRVRRGDETLRRAKGWLNDMVHDKQPVFLFFHLFDPHEPYEAPEPYGKRFAPKGGFRAPPRAEYDRLRTEGPRAGELEEYTARYDGEIAYSDHLVGELLKHLEERGYMKRSTIIITSDHGETLGERPWVLDHGERVSEEQVRVPLMIRLPSDQHGGARVKTQVEHADIMPTVLAHLGIPSPEVYGRALPLDGSEPEARPAFSLAVSVPERMTREVPAPLGQGLVAGVRAPPNKLVVLPGADGNAVRLLFDLKADPLEKSDLAGQQPPALGEMSTTLESWTAKTGAKLAAPPPELSNETREGLKALGYVR
jgi:choline-sulfatase